jgi:hypothetical protein
MARNFADRRGCVAGAAQRAMVVCRRMGDRSSRRRPRVVFTQISMSVSCGGTCAKFWRCFHPGRYSRPKRAYSLGLSRDALPRSGVNSLWCRPAGEAEWLLEFLLDDAIEDEWVFRRQPDIRRRLSTIVRRTDAGLPYLAPEIQLLYKSRNPRPRDESDFRLIAPRLDGDARAWLNDALARTDPGHAWNREPQVLK